MCMKRRNMKQKIALIGVVLLFSACQRNYFTADFIDMAMEYKTPYKKSCRNNGGKYYENRKSVYIDKWTANGSYALNRGHKCTGLSLNEAKQACSERKKKLPSLYELRAVAKACGSNNVSKNKDNKLIWNNTKSEKLYHQCWKKTGLESLIYLTSTVTKDGNMVSYSLAKSGSSQKTLEELNINDTSWGLLTLEKATEISRNHVICK